MQIQRSYDDKLKLFLIPTPIGNMEDITERAINYLKEVNTIFCEDTRITGQLLKKLDISKKLISYNTINEKEKIDLVIEKIKEEKMVAIVSDRGTPLISDPGYNLVNKCIENDINVISLPGANAFVPALLISGMNPYPFLFYGFLKGNKSHIKTTLINLKTLPYTLIFYESPHHLLSTLKLIFECLGNRKVAVVREISKIYEEAIRGKLEEVIKYFEENEIKGEFVIVLQKSDLYVNYDMSIDEHVEMYINEGMTKNEAIKKVANDLGKSKSEIYKIYHLRR